MKKVLLVLTLLALLIGLPALPQAPGSSNLAERLGYPAGSKLLIIHADDLGVAHAVNQASFEAYRKGVISSGSIMVNCPWFPEVANYAGSHPDSDLGIHLTLTSEWDQYRWGPVASSDLVSSLLDPSGYLWGNAQAVAATVKPEEAEREFRAQIDKAAKAGIRISHLDSHMGTAFGAQLFPVYVKLAREYNLPFFVVRLPGAAASMLQLLRETDLVLDNWAMAGPAVKSENWFNYYANVVKGLKPGVTQLIVHVGFDTDELRGVMTESAPFGSAWRQRDYDVLSSPAFAGVLKDNDVKLVGWNDLRKAQAAATP
jgi:chitin disaccharide deacetylase